LILNFIYRYPLLDCLDLSLKSTQLFLVGFLLTVSLLVNALSQYAQVFLTLVTFSTWNKNFI
jgi:hypothetical protein